MRVEEEGEEQMEKQQDELQRDRELQLELLEEDEYEEWRTSLVDLHDPQENPIGEW